MSQPPAVGPGERSHDTNPQPDWQLNSPIMVSLLPNPSEYAKNNCVQRPFCSEDSPSYTSPPSAVSVLTLPLRSVLKGDRISTVLGQLR